MSEHPPTPEQQLCYDAATQTADNLLIKALAGAAKTTTLVGIAQRLAPTPMLCLAFNKRIAEEMKQRLPSTCVAKTLNSLGHMVWGQVLGKRLTLDDKKVYRLTRAYIEQQKGEAQEELWAFFAEIMQAVREGKTSGWVPEKRFDRHGLLDDNEFFAELEEEYSDTVWECIRQVSIASIVEALQGTIDFDDQILMPTLWPCFFPNYRVVMVDEAQDLSALNHAMLAKLVKQRLIAVGDECQSIYGFRGAHADSMEVLEKQFKMTPLTLSVSFRCPITVIESARWRAPHMQWPEWAKPGAVLALAEWDQTKVPEHACIICRNNAPLFRMAIALLKAGRFPELVGNDIGRNLIKVLKKLGDGAMSQDDATKAVLIWKGEKLKKSRSPKTVEDMAECLNIFLGQGATLGAAIAYAESLLAQAGTIKLMTGHKSKGLEFDHVFFLDEFLISKEYAQERNLRYVIQTRAKETLTYVRSEDFTL